MRFLADESCDMAVVRALRTKGHDVMLVRDREAGMSDASVARMAQHERRVVLTEDKDFGQLARALAGATIGVMLLRFPHSARAKMGVAVVDAVDALSERLEGAFVVVEPGRFRVNELKP